MSHQLPPTESLSVSEARQQLSQLLNRVCRREAHVVVEKNGLPVAALISHEEFHRFRNWEARYLADVALLNRMSDAFADVSDEELQREIDRAIAEVRAERDLRDAEAAAS